jgi:hypothetical protein
MAGHGHRDMPPPFEEYHPMRYLRLISIAMTVLGIALVAASMTFTFGGMWTLTGLLLVVAGVVKIIMVELWQSVAGFGAPQPSREDR